MKHVVTAALATLLVAPMAGATDFVTGDLGNVGPQKGMAAAPSVMNGIMAHHFGAAPEQEMHLIGSTVDAKGNHHYRFMQSLNGLPVVGAEAMMHVGPEGNIWAVNADFSPAKNVAVKPGLKAEQAFAGLTKSLRADVAAAELVYVYHNGMTVLSWQTTVEYTDAQGAQRDLVFVDANSGEIVARHPQHFYARSLATYSCNNTSCGTLVSNSSNAINTGDAAADAAHNYAIATYDYYFANHNRDSIDNNGMTLRSRVHYGNSYNNAFWDGSQMTYGDGDGTTFIPLSQDADVVAHELTHGVTERSSGLIYSNESGALNEALSDIFGAMVDRQEGANTVDTWLLGEDIYTPGTPGDALRVMNDPAAAGDYDYYPTRYTGTSDNGGVHWNSGIANLAYVLLVEGGSHPRGKTSVNVSGIGFDKAAAIFYAANTGCLTAASNFAAARGCTADAAATLYGAAEEASVHAAWDAVGVPYPTPPAPPIALVDGQPVALELGAGETQAYTLEVGAGASSVTFTTAGANGDADLYVKFGQTATRNNADCVSESSNSNETCTVSSPAEGTWHASVFAYSAFTGLTMTGETGGGGSCSAQGDSCSAGTDCCSGSCSGGKPSSRVCL